jgi:formylglycine-generating enzyme
MTQQDLIPHEFILNLMQDVNMKFVRIPAGSFLMGSRTDKIEAFTEEKPSHKIYLDEYWLAKTPVTVMQFAEFVNASGYQTTAEQQGFAHVWIESKWFETKGACWKHPHGPDSNIDKKSNHPVTQVSWVDALAFTNWMTELVKTHQNQRSVFMSPELAPGSCVHLPSEAQWEKAARGTEGLIYPWGNESPNGSYCNFNFEIKDTTEIGIYSPLGNSPFNCLDMAGNVFEWCNDWYQEDYYQQIPIKNPNGPAPGHFKVVRGGSWRSEDTLFIRSANRYRRKPLNMYYDNGFRCALHIPGN